MLEEMLNAKTKNQLVKHLRDLGLKHKKSANKSDLVRLLLEQKIPRFVAVLSTEEVQDFLYQMGMSSQSTTRDKKELVSMLKTGENLQGDVVVFFSDSEIKKSTKKLKALLYSEDLDIVDQGIELWEALSYTKTAFRRILESFGLTDLDNISSLEEIKKSVFGGYATYGHMRKTCGYVSVWILEKLIAFDLTPTDFSSLDLSNSSLSEVPEFIQHLTGLKHLHLGNNSLSRLPDWLRDLRHLEDINLDYNPLLNCSTCLRQLPSVEVLSFAGNNVQSIPIEMKRFSKLRILDLSNNQIQQIPDFIGELTSLEDISLQSNAIAALPIAMRKLHNLRVLDLRYCGFWYKNDQKAARKSLPRFGVYF